MTTRFPGSIEVVVRPVREEDWSSYRDLRLKALRSDPRAFRSTLQREQGFSPESCKARITCDRNTASAETWVAVNAAGRFVGTIGAAHIEGAICRFAMGVDADHRRAGIRGQLLDAALMDPPVASRAFHRS